ncbi:MAG: ankyrin repeat domain-containing protein [Gammaproteobacteria bacterium WSBS_2016_MAG_OTU1]
MAKVLLDNGANVNYEYKEDGMTALMFAAMQGHSEVAKVLLDNGANVNHENKDGWTTLMFAAMEDIAK